MKFQRLYTKDSPAFSWKFTDSIIKDADGNVIFEAKNIEVPSHWSETAVNILAQKYFRRTGVPFVTVTREAVLNMPDWLWPRKAEALSTLRGETSAREVFHRLAGCWTYWGWKMGLFSNKEEDAINFYEEVYYMLFNQIAAPNSPQWFNTGLNWAYGITDYAEGYWRVDDTGEVTSTKGEVYEVKDRYLNPQPHACFIQPVADNLTDQGGIFDLLTKEAKLFKQGSGTGTNFSALRSKGEPLAGGGRSSGLMSFLRIFDRAADSVKSGGITRRAAKMVVLDLDHPEIEDFINWKVKEEHKAACLFTGSKVIARGKLFDKNAEIPQPILDRETNGFDPVVYELGWEDEAISTVSGQNSNNSVRVTNRFMECVKEDHDWFLLNRTNETIVKTIPAKDLWHQICRAAWACGDPGVQFHDTMNMWNTCTNDGMINSTNPCSEYVFLDNTACNLASINLGKFGSGADFDKEAFQHATRIWTCILDISVTMASYPSKEIALGSHNFRTLGLGYANLAHLLHEEGLKYDSDAGRNRAAHLTALLHFTAYKTSCELAFYLGAFPRWENNKSSMESVLYQHNNAARDRGYTLLLSPTAAYRNAQVTLIAPTGTIALLMDCETTGVEPYYAPRVTKNLAGGGLFNFDNDIPVSECAVGEGCLAPEAHVKMVAAIQSFLSGGVSKTVNLPNSATVEDVDKIYRLAHKLGLKSISLYRDGSKLTQPLETKKEERVQKEEKPIGYGMFQVPKEYGVFKEVTNLRPHAARSSLPNKRGGYTRKFKINGQTAYLRTGEYEDGKLGEIFVNLAKEGSTARALMDAFSKAISIGLQYGVPLDEFVDAFKGARFEPSGFVQGHETIKQTASIIDFIFRELEETYLMQKEPMQRELFQQPVVPTPDGRAPKVETKMDVSSNGGPESGKAPPLGKWERNSGEFCACGHEMLRTGTCLTCPNCGANTGCG